MVSNSSFWTIFYENTIDWGTHKNGPHKISKMPLFWTIRTTSNARFAHFGDPLSRIVVDEKTNKYYFCKTLSAARRPV